MLLILLVVNGFQELANFFDAGGLDLLVLVLHSDLASVLGFESSSQEAQIKNRLSEDGSNELISRDIKDVMYPVG